MKIYYYLDEMYPVFYPEDKKDSWVKEGDVSKEVWEEYLEALSAFNEAHNKVSAELSTKVEK